MPVDDLNSRLGIQGVAEVVAGNGGLPKVRITTPTETKGEIYLYGAQVMSWQPEGSNEVIFVSQGSHWEEGRAIRGGIPVCFPWFRGKADDPGAPAHGLVRTKQWNLKSITAEQNDVTVVCTTESDESTRRRWPYEFQLTHRIDMGLTLRMELTVANTGDKPFRFEEALHTYFRVADVECVVVAGLPGVAYLDNLDGNQRKVQEGGVRLSGPVDNAYVEARGATAIMDPKRYRILCTEKENSASTIVWNPWQQGAAKLTDLGDDEWRQMICVEAGNILDAAVSLAPGESHSMRVTLRSPSWQPQSHGRDWGPGGER